MASIGPRLRRGSSRLLSGISSFHSLLKPRCAASTVRRYQTTVPRWQFSVDQQPEAVPADKYQNTEIPEEVRRKAALASWNDPRKATPVDKANEEAMMDPTIRHFTINFVSII